MPDSIFISKNSGEVSLLQNFANERNLDLFACSFLEFRPVSFELPTHFDVIFFGSPRSVMFFQSRFSIPSTAEIACVGGKTASLLQSMGHNVAFNGEDKGSISEVAAAFRNWLNDKTVLFPVSTRSLGTISGAVPAEQSLIVECYETALRKKALDKSFDTYIFTSPSNVEGFFTQNSLPGNAQVIAWGESTAKALNEHQVSQFSILNQPSLDCLIEFLEK